MYNLVTDNALLLSVGEIVFMIDGFLRVRRWRVRVNREIIHYARLSVLQCRSSLCWPDDSIWL